MGVGEGGEGGECGEVRKDGDKSLNISKNSFIIWAIICVAFAGFIFSNSFRTGSQSVSQSSWVLRIFIDVFGFLIPTGVSVESVHTVIRKAAHFSEFAVFGALLFLMNRSGAKIGIKISIFVNLFCGLFIGVVDEFIQFFVPFRGSTVTDVVIDFCGFVFGTFVVLGVLKLVKLLRRRKK